MMQLIQWVIDMKLMIQWAITSSALILIVLATRFFLKDRLSARLRYALWGVVLLRLLVPFQVALPAPVTENLPVLASNLAPEVGQWEKPSIPVLPERSKPVAEFNLDIETTLEPGDILSYSDVVGCLRRDGETITWYRYILSPEQIVLALWLAGAGLTGAAMLVSNLRFHGRLRKRRERLEGVDAPIPVYVAEGLSSPCLFGVFKSAVYVTPEAAKAPDTLRHVLAHELTHYAHKDHIWSLLRCLTLALHWYNPLVWLAVGLSKRDGELACDEGAVARLGEAERVPYGRTLVDMVAKRSLRPGDLLSCSTAMTGGEKSVKARVLALVKKPETVKTALFAVIAVVALAAVFVFAGRGQPDNIPHNFLGYVERADSIQYSPPLYSSVAYPYPITDEDLLAEAKKGLSGVTYLRYDDTQPDLHSSKLHHASKISLPNEYAENVYTLLWQNDRTYLLTGDVWEDLLELREINGGDPQIVGQTGILVSEPGVNLIAILEELAQRQKDAIRIPLGTATLDGSPLERFQAEAAQAASIRLGMPLYSSAGYPDPITDPDLLALAKEALSKFVPQDPETVVTGWGDRMFHAYRVILSDGENETVYGLLTGEDGRTYLFLGEDCGIGLDEGETMEIAPIGRTEGRHNVIGSLSELARRQQQLSQDPSTPIPLTAEELGEYTPLGIQRDHGYQLQGWSGDLARASFYHGTRVRSDGTVQLWYHGDEEHDDVWVLEIWPTPLSSHSSGYNIGPDQPMVVYNAGRHAGEEASYEQLGAGAFAAALRPGDVISVTAGDYEPGQAVEVDLQTLKEQLTTALYHQLSTEFDEEKHGQYVITVRVEKDVGYYLHDGGRDGLILSAGSEADVVCLRHRVLSVPDGMGCQFVRSPELYHAIRDIFD